MNARRKQRRGDRLRAELETMHPDDRAQIEKIAEGYDLPTVEFWGAFGNTMQMRGLLLGQARRRAGDAILAAFRKSVRR